MKEKLRTYLRMVKITVYQWYVY